MLDSDKFLTGIGVAILAGVAYLFYKESRYEWNWYPTDKTLEEVEGQYRIKIEPKGKIGFTLFIDNLSDRELTVNWDESRYLRGGTTDGGFSDRKGTDTVLPNSYASWSLYPKTLKRRKTNVKTYHHGEKISYIPSYDWNQDDLKAGEHGVYLALGEVAGLDMRKVPLSIRWKRELSS